MRIEGFEYLDLSNLFFVAVNNILRAIYII